MDQKKRGLFKKYNVSRTDKKPLKGGCIVLEFGSKNAAHAVLQFADSVEVDGYGKLAADLRLKMDCFHPNAELERHKKARAQQEINDGLRKEIAYMAKAFDLELKRLDALLAKSHELNGRLLHQLDRADMQPLPTRVWQAENVLKNNYAEAPAKKVAF